MSSKAAMLSTLLLLAAPAAAAAADADPTASLPSVTIAAVSISAVDVEKTAGFYEAVFGMQEVRRIDARPDFLEIIMKPGRTPEDARAAPGAAFIVISRPQGTSSEFPNVQGWARAHAALVVPEMAPVIERTKDNGGSVEVAPYVGKGGLESETDAHPGGGGSHIDAMIKDPAGNFIELLSPK
jgi:catechol 2,3-dioxygenase-like lactoylglutathione lyase family enzyme